MCTESQTDTLKVRRSDGVFLLITVAGWMNQEQQLDKLQRERLDVSFQRKEPKAHYWVSILRVYFLWRKSLVNQD